MCRCRALKVENHHAACTAHWEGLQAVRAAKASSTAFGPQGAGSSKACPHTAATRVLSLFSTFKNKTYDERHDALSCNSAAAGSGGTNRGTLSVNDSVDVLLLMCVLHACDRQCLAPVLEHGGVCPSRPCF